MSSAPAGCQVELRAVFAVRGEDRDGALAAVAGLIDRLNEVANEPQHECDVQMSVAPSRANGEPALGGLA